METLKDKSVNYEPPKTKVVSDLETVRLDSQVEEREGSDKEDKPFKYNVIVVDGEDYRVPNSVLNSIKAISKEKLDLAAIKVVRTGEGMNTKYQVIPL